MSSTRLTDRAQYGTNTCYNSHMSELNKDILNFQSFDDTIGRPIVQYTTLDFQGRQVTINPKNPANHDSYHKLEQHPTVYYNLGTVLSHPDSVEISTSKARRACEHRETGQVMLYKKKGFIASLDIPANDWNGEETMIVVVKYEDASKVSNPENYTLSYRIS